MADPSTCYLRGRDYENNPILRSWWGVLVFLAWYLVGGLGAIASCVWGFLCITAAAFMWLGYAPPGEVGPWGSLFMGSVSMAAGLALRWMVVTGAREVLTCPACGERHD